MAATRDGWTDLVKALALSATILVPLGGLILYQGSILRSEIRDLRTEMRAEIGDLRETVDEIVVSVDNLVVSVAELSVSIANLNGSISDLEVSVTNLEIAVARIEARRSLRLMLAQGFAASGEGASVGGPTIAAGLLLARARPEIDSVLGTIDQDAQSELANDLWEDRANILARATPIL